jgi:hypothetical protein
MHLAAAAFCACAAFAYAGEAPAHGRFLVDVEVSRIAAEDFVASFHVRDAATRQLIGEPSVAFSAAPDAPVMVAARPTGACAAGGEQGYCVDFVAGVEGRTSAFEAIITDAGLLRARNRAVALSGR